MSLPPVPVSFPASTSAIDDALRSAAARIEPLGPRRAQALVLGFLGGKGGVGTSTMACFAAVHAATALDLRVLLVDCDIAAGDQALLLGVEPTKTLLDLSQSSVDVDAHKLSTIVARDRVSGVELVAAPRNPEEAPLVREQTLRELVEFGRRAYDVVVIDCGSRFDDHSLAAIDVCDRLCVVTGPGVAATKGAAVALRVLRRLHVGERAVTVIRNDVAGSNACARRDVAKALRRRIDFDVPFDARVQLACDVGKPAMALDDKRAAGARAIAAMVGVLARDPYAPRQRFARATQLLAQAPRLRDRISDSVLALR